MNEINPIKFTTSEEVQPQSTTKQKNELLFNFDSENVSDDYSAMGFESKRRKSITHNPDGTTRVSCYDDNGRISKEIVYNKNGEQKELIDYTYGFRTFKNGEKVPITKTKHEYWDNGKQTGMTMSTIIDGIEADREEHVFNEYEATKTCTVYENGNLVGRTEFTYFDDGNEKEERRFDKNNKLDAIVEYIYLEDARVLKKTNVKTGEVTTVRFNENNPEILKGTVDVEL